ncbi:MAG TPA: MutL protein, partial [Peptococcaceae bacterium]|nr:MutL protein [Peptococcaceae bacterium]
TEAYSSEGKFWVQRGKDLTKVDSLVGTGGALVYADDPESLLVDGLRLDDPLSLTPRQPQLILDHEYLLYAIGLLAEGYPEVAEILIQETLMPLGR